MLRCTPFYSAIGLLYLLLITLACQPRIAAPAYHRDYPTNLTTNREPYVLNLSFCIIRDANGEEAFTDGSGTLLPAIDEETIQDAVALINRTYNRFDIFFKYTGTGYLDSTNLLTVSRDEFDHTLNHLPYRERNAFTIFIAHHLSIDTGIPGLPGGCGRLHDTYAVIERSKLLTTTLPLLLAHNLAGLPPGRVIDDEPERLLTPTSGNSLRASIAEERFTAAATTVASLYLPYYGGYSGGAYRTGQPPIPPPKFQKGFDYLFVDCEDEDHVVQHYTKDQIPEGHPMFTAIKILQVSEQRAMHCNLPRP